MRASGFNRIALVIGAQWVLLATFHGLDKLPPAAMTWHVFLCVFLVFPVPVVGYIYVLHTSPIAEGRPRFLRTILAAVLPVILTLFGFVLGMAVFAIISIVLQMLGFPAGDKMPGI